MVTVYPFADIEQDIGVIKRNITGERSSVIGGIPVSYQTYEYNDGYEFKGTRWCSVDRKGHIYISDLPGAPPELREQFQDLVAYHERLEFDWLVELGLPAPRWSILHVDESVVACGIHNQVHYMELKAANNMGILDEYVNWRPKENGSGKYGSLTEEFSRRLKAA